MFSSGVWSEDTFLKERCMYVSVNLKVAEVSELFLSLLGSPQYTREGGQICNTNRKTQYSCSNITRY